MEIQNQKYAKLMLTMSPAFESLSLAFKNKSHDLVYFWFFPL